MTRYITERVDPKEVLSAEVKAAGGQTAWSRRHGIARSFVTNALAGRRPFSAKLLAALGIVKTTVYMRTRIEPTFVNLQLGEPWTPPEGDKP